ncbi:hypothetical protein SAMN05216421_1935 [Halopseudomonas xinjiangensis]|uniref:MetA-pathway of phenol degradation n=2 Tax=Halopseudomonas xinjiangensis TaxID=487184 RepID=A0A1H1U0P3_9GAMM|nr:hypothetical protein SAMN05216421_1935 [Halopseudomonas xinjiangensis]
MNRPSMLHRSARRVPSPGAILLTAVSALSFGVAMPVSAGAWVQEQGRTLTILKLAHTEDATAFDASSERTRFPDRGNSRQDQINLYIEHGLTPDLTAIGNFYYNDVSYDSDTFSGSTRGFGDQELALRYRLNPGSGDTWVGALQGLVSIPTYDDDEMPALGLGDYAFELRYSVGRGYVLGGRNGYIDAGAAIRLRSDDPADEFRFDIASGIALNPHWMLMGEVNVIEGLGNGEERNRLAFIDSTDYDLTKLQASLLFTPGAGNVHFQVGYTKPVLGRNTGGADGPFVAAWWRF